MYLHTDGSGIWSSYKTSVKITRIGLNVPSYDCIPELLVYFDRDTWKVEEHGLIYTDNLFEAELQEFLRDCGFDDIESVSYSEQGMQGRNYVSFDTSHPFAVSYDQSVIDCNMKSKS